MTAQPFGKLADGTPVELYTLSDGAYEVRIATYGGIVVSLKAPDRNGKSADVVLGFDDVDGYVANFNGPSDAFLGAIIGRDANRIAHGNFNRDGKKYFLPQNNGEKPQSALRKSKGVDSTAFNSPVGHNNSLRPPAIRLP